MSLPNKTSTFIDIPSSLTQPLPMKCCVHACRSHPGYQPVMILLEYLSCLKNLIDMKISKHTTHHYLIISTYHVVTYIATYMYVCIILLCLFQKTILTTITAYVN